MGGPAEGPPGGEDSDATREEYGSSEEEVQIPRLRAGRQAAAPPFGAHLQPQIEATAADLVLETQGRARFEAFSPPDFLQAAETLARHRLPPMAIIRQTDRGARRMFLADLRGLERKASRKCSC